MARKVAIHLIAIVLISAAIPRMSSAANPVAESVGGQAFGVKVKGHIHISAGGPVGPQAVQRIDEGPLPITILPAGGGWYFNTTFRPTVVTSIIGNILETGLMRVTTYGIVNAFYLPDEAHVVSTADVHGLRIFPNINLITADSVHTQANSDYDKGVATSSAAGTTFTNLNIATIGPVDSPAPNTVYRLERAALAPLGRFFTGEVRLNEQILSGDGVLTSRLTVNAIHVIGAIHDDAGDLSTYFDITIGSATSDVAKLIVQERKPRLDTLVTGPEARFGDAVLATGELWAGIPAAEVVDLILTADPAIGGMVTTIPKANLTVIPGMPQTLEFTVPSGLALGDYTIAVRNMGWISNELKLKIVP